MLTQASTHKSAVGKPSVHSLRFNPKLPRTDLIDSTNPRELVKWNEKKPIGLNLSGQKCPEVQQSTQRVNLIYLCKTRTLSEEDRKPAAKETSNTRSSECSTHNSSFNGKDSVTSSPMMPSLELNDETI